MKRIGTEEFRARQREVLAEVARTGKPIVIVRRGTPLAEVHPIGTHARLSTLHPTLPADRGDE